MSNIINPNGGKFELTLEQKLKQMSNGEFLAHLVSQNDQMFEIVVLEAIRSYAEKVSIMPAPTINSNEKVDLSRFHEVACTINNQFILRNS